MGRITWLLYPPKRQFYKMLSRPISTRIFWKKWKHLRIEQLTKKGNKPLPENYRLWCLSSRDWCKIILKTRQSDIRSSTSNLLYLRILKSGLIPSTKFSMGQENIHSTSWVFYYIPCGDLGNKQSWLHHWRKIHTVPCYLLQISRGISKLPNQSKTKLIYNTIPSY